LLKHDFENAKKWCYTGIGVMPGDVKMRDYLRDNDWSYPIIRYVLRVSQIPPTVSAAPL
jgi:hypothetical protein|tara:strand:+ start:9448 stop:9624 length:177 start_codon:yes stop_codon:yes gene_type:complete